MSKSTYRDEHEQLERAAAEVCKDVIRGRLSSRHGRRLLESFQEKMDALARAERRARRKAERLDPPQLKFVLGSRI
jgi:hypothetical protein